MYKFHVQPSELERLEFYRIHYALKQYEEHIARENKEYEKQQKEAEAQSKTNMPNYGNYKPPKIDMPKMPTFK